MSTLYVKTGPHCVLRPWSTACWKTVCILRALGDTAIVLKMYDLSLCQYRRSYIFTNKDHISGFVSVQRGAILKGRIACTECKDAACCCRCSVVCLCVRVCLFVRPVSSIGCTDRDAVCVWWAQRTIKLGPRSCKGKEQFRGMLPTPIRSTLKDGIILPIPIVPAACSRSTRFS